MIKTEATIYDSNNQPFNKDGYKLFKVILPLNTFKGDTSLTPIMAKVSLDDFDDNKMQNFIIEAKNNVEVFCLEGNLEQYENDSLILNIEKILDEKDKKDFQENLSINFKGKINSLKKLDKKIRLDFIDENNNNFNLLLLTDKFLDSKFLNKEDKLIQTINHLITENNLFVLKCKLCNDNEQPKIFINKINPISQNGEITDINSKLNDNNNDGPSNQDSKINKIKYKKPSKNQDDLDNTNDNNNDELTKAYQQISTLKNKVNEQQEKINNYEEELSNKSNNTSNEQVSSVSNDKLAEIILDQGDNLNSIVQNLGLFMKSFNNVLPALSYLQNLYIDKENKEKIPSFDIVNKSINSINSETLYSNDKFNKSISKLKIDDKPSPYTDIINEALSIYDNDKDKGKNDIKYKQNVNKKNKKILEQKEVK